MRRPVRAALALALGLVAAIASAGCGRALVDAASGCAYPERTLAAGFDGVCSTATGDSARAIRELARSAAAADLAVVTVDYPRQGSIFPPDFAAPTFLWHDADGAADSWLVDLAFERGTRHAYVLVEDTDPPQGEIDPRCISATNEIYRPTAYQASARAWRPSAELWAAIRSAAVDAPVTVKFLGYRSLDPSRVRSAGSTEIVTSRDPVAARIFYRDVPLMPAEGQAGVIQPLDKSAVPLIAWRLRDVGRDDSRVLLRDMPTCANCHSFAADGKTMGMDVDGPDGDKGAYTVVARKRQTVIESRDVLTWNAFPGKTPNTNTLGFLSQVSPDGAHAIATVNEAIYVRNFTDFRFGQVFYPTRGILAWYARDTGQIRALPGADDPQYVHCDPAWSPDGKSIVFARARARDPYPAGLPLATYAGDPNETPIQYDLYRMPFDGGRGGVAEPIAGASANGMSNTFPKVSPDGRWIVFVKCKNGQLMRPDGELWIVPAAGGAARRMRCNTSRMNSWHSFSPNGRWMVFSSKSETPYTQMYLTHIDENGDDSPPILVAHATAANRAVNIPEFVNVAWEDFVSISVPAVDHYLYFGRANELAREGKIEQAVAEFERALEGTEQPWRVNDWRIHDGMSKTLLQLGDMQRALEHTRAALRLNPYNWEMQGNLGLLLAERGEVGQALEHLDMALRINPKAARVWSNRGALRLRLGDEEGALADYGRAIEVNPTRADAWSGRGMIRYGRGLHREAIADFDHAIEREPGDPVPWYFRALAEERLGLVERAAEDAARALALAPEGWPRRPELRALDQRLRARSRGA